MELSYPDGQGNFINWSGFLDKSATSFTPPVLPANLLGLTPPTTGVGTFVEGFGIDSVMGLDSLLTGMQAFSGNLDKFFLGTASDGRFVCRGESALAFSIGGTGTGTVTVDNGTGPVTVTDGQTLLFDSGTDLTVTATADANFNVTQMDCPFGPAGGLPAPSAQCFMSFNDASSDTIVISFD